MFYAPFLKPESFNPADTLADAAFWVLSERGVATLSLSSVAHHLGVSTSAVVQQSGGRARFERLVVGQFSQRWYLWVTGSGATLDIPFALPLDDHEVRGVRVWLALGELARGEAAAGRTNLAEMVSAAHVRAWSLLHERLQIRLGRILSDIERDATVALVRGVHAAMADMVNPMPLDRAIAICRDHLQRSLGAEPTTRR